MSDKALLAAFVIYTLAWEGLVWIGGMHIILTHHWSGWWVLFLLLLSSMQFPPKRFRELLGVDTTTLSPALDARLIAAAPELLAALSDALNMLDGYAALAGSDHIQDMVRDNARAAIAKARAPALDDARREDDRGEG